jgi:phage-related minor tail protein
MNITSEVYDTLVKIIDERMRDIKVTREDFSELRDTVAELAKGQSELRKAVQELAEAQRRTDQRLEELAEAQKKTEQSVARLAQTVGALSDNIGYGLEDIAKVVLPPYLYKYFNIKIEDFEPRFFIVDKGEIEVNLYGEGEKNGKKVIILGESKARIYEGEVKKFINDTNKLKIEDEVIRLMFGYLVHPSAQKIATSNDIILIASYQR